MRRYSKLLGAFGDEFLRAALRFALQFNFVTGLEVAGDFKGLAIAARSRATRLPVRPAAEARSP
jgi:hypothetical protein